MDPDGRPAFTDLYDWLPLRRHPTATAPKKKPGRLPKAWNDRENHHDDGTLGYFPFVSVYGGAVVRLNPGPYFLHPPEDATSTWRPLSERFSEYYSEVRSLDERDEAEALGNMPAELELGLRTDRAAPIQAMELSKEQDNFGSVLAEG